MTKIPEQTNADKITPQVAAGKRIWEENNCMGCHTLFGEGAYYAPELTLAVKRRGKPWLRMFLKDPQAMFPGERKMVQYNFTGEEIEEVIAFLEWAGEVDLNGFPADPPLREKMGPAVVAASAVATANPAPELYATICAACHTVGGQGGTVGPALDDISQRKSPAELREWIAEPQKVKPGTTMPQIPMTEEQLDEIVVYLSSLSS
jgi:nitric oxide reductase subunit C